MKQIACIAQAIHEYSSAILLKAFSGFLLMHVSLNLHAQAVSGIITDYNGFWKTAAAAPNPSKPDNSHNLIAFTYNGQQYSTGVNDALLSSRGESFVPGDFWSLPVGTLTGTVNSNTKAGFGALFDGTFNGPGSTPPEYGISIYLTDGIKGLNIGTCIANLPAGAMTFSISNIQAASIGDGVPDILVTQIADPAGSYDRYEFTDVNGVRVGNYKDIVFTNIAPVATWTADFYEAKNNPLTLLGGFTQTDRPMRLWAADLSEFGITAANYSQIRNFKINLSGQSDVAFVAYNNQSVNFQNPLPVQYSFFRATLVNEQVKLSWQTVSEQDADRFIIERSADGVLFREIGAVKAKNQPASRSDYQFTDAAPLRGAAYYRLKQIDLSGSYHHSSTIIKIHSPQANAAHMEVYPNPCRGKVFVSHPAAEGQQILLMNASGMVLQRLAPGNNAIHTTLDLQGLPAGTYFISLGNGDQRQTKKILVN